MKRIKVKTTIIIDMVIDDDIHLGDAIDDLIINIKSNHQDSSYVFDSELTYYEDITDD